MQTLLNALEQIPIIPVATIHKVEQAVPLAEALFEGGLRTIEVTLRTPCALDAINAIALQVPNIQVGAGTVKSMANLQDAYMAGAQFAVSPGITIELLQAAKNGGMSFIPGVSTTSEALQALEYGFTYLKLFPAHLLNSINLLKTWENVLPEISFCPTGGVDQINLCQYLTHKNVFAVGGSFICPSELLAKENYKAISQIAQQSIQSCAL